jgi:hypothetical protein
MRRVRHGRGDVAQRRAGGVWFQSRAGRVVGHAGPAPAPAAPASQARSVTRRPLVPMELPAADRAKLEANLKAAEAELAKPRQRRRDHLGGPPPGYLCNTDAITTFTGIDKFPRDARFYRHRGHRYITVRSFDAAISGLSRPCRSSAARKTRSSPTARRTPPACRARCSSTSGITSGWPTTSKAISPTPTRYEECMKVSDNDDSITATTDWRWTLMRMGDKAGAAKVLERITPRWTSSGAHIAGC